MRLVVVGDTLLDVDLVGSASRLCPDAPAPVLDLDRQHSRPGGAGLAAALAAANGIAVMLVTAIAEDDDGLRLRAELDGIPTVLGTSPAPTSVKTRLRCAGQSLARIDRGGGESAPVVTDEMLAAVRAADAVLVSDYGRGLARDRRLRELLAASAATVPIVWDPHPHGPPPVPGVRLVTPNLGEALRAAGMDGGDQGLAAAARAAEILRARWEAAAVAVTLGSRGALLDQGGVPVAAPAPPVTVTDPCGAGDQFAVAAASRLMAGDAPADAVRTAVHAASRFLLDGGVATVGRHPVLRCVDETDGASEARGMVAATRAGGGTVVATGGCFDVLHAGHARTLAAARALGDCLIVCLNSDRSVRRRDGRGRPINSHHDRAALLRSLRCVDAVAVFDEDTPKSLVDELRPDVWVTGGDGYWGKGDGPSEATLLESWGGRVVAVPDEPADSRSVTELAEVG